MAIYETLQNHHVGKYSNIYMDQIGQGSHVDKEKFATRTGVLEFEYRNHYIYTLRIMGSQN